MSNNKEQEHCALCDCILYRDGNYAKDIPEGRSGASEHHFVAKRFFGEGENEVRPIFTENPFDVNEKKTTILCYECHEPLLHNPVLLAKDMERLANIFEGLEAAEKEGKPKDKKIIGKRIEIFHQAISLGIEALSLAVKAKKSMNNVNLKRS